MNTNFQWQVPEHFAVNLHGCGSITIVMTAAGARGWKLQVLNASTESGIDGAFATLVQEGARALLLGNDPFFYAPPSTRGTGRTPRDPDDLSASRVRGGRRPAELRN
jgi:hypothetical protein